MSISDDQCHSSIVEFDQKSHLYIFHCPNCGGIVEVEENQLNCRIFRHGFFFVKNGEQLILTNQMNPHESKEVCDRLVHEGKVVGCAKPFRVVDRGETKVVETCGYI